MSAPNFSTEKPYVICTNTFDRKGAFYTLERAVEEIKTQRGTRKLYGMHRGDWKLLAVYRNGVKLPLP
jgi:hypothetical protein